MGSVPSVPLNPAADILGLIVPYIVRVDVKFDAEWLYHEWRRGWEQAQPEFVIENIRFDHDPEWRYRLFSLQSAHDGNHWFWKATKVVMMPFIGAI